jgi:hypothetical protein
MGFWFAGDADAARFQKQGNGWLKRFDPRFWTVNFPRPMMAAVTTTAPDALRVDAVFYRTDDLAGLIWDAADTIDHPLLRYETARDFRGCTLAFHWRSSGMMPLDAVNGPTLTIEGRDVTGAPRSWYVRLWNYATGTAEDAQISLDFGHIDGGFLLPGEADPVWAGDVDRMFVSLVPPGYTGASAELAAPAEAWVELTGIVCDGAGSTLAIGDALVPPHGLAIATGYDDAYNQTPARVLRQILALGYRGAIDHYVGMSHYFRLEWNEGAALHLVSLTGGALNVAAAAWHADFLARAAALGFEVILSLSYELLDQHCWDDWKQRGPDGIQALSLLGSLDNGASWQAIGDTAAAVLGTTLTALPPGGAMLFDEIASFDVELLNDAMTLAGDDMLGASATTNLAMVGDELIQFGQVEQIAPQRFRLRRLLRGRRAASGRWRRMRSVSASSSSMRGACSAGRCRSPRSASACASPRPGSVIPARPRQ